MKVISFVAQKEITTNPLDKQKYVCVNIGPGMAVSEQAGLAQLRGRGMRLHPRKWCDNDVQGMRIDISTPMHGPAAALYEC